MSCHHHRSRAPEWLAFLLVLAAVGTVIRYWYVIIPLAAVCFAAAVAWQVKHK